ncbi:MAG: hypothetical protein V7K69_27565 [Nostoc sp.]|uniref:hypothetical protein n=1 Tax=Nostoc sp. TaxID=1180 RepID=UPI002FF471F1
MYTQVIDSHATFRVLISAFGIPRLKDHGYHPEPSERGVREGLSPKISFEFSAQPFYLALLTL